MGAACAGEPANGHKLSNGHKLAKGRGLRWRACEGVDEVDELRNALEELRENVITWDTSAQQVKDAFGVSPWAAVEMPARAGIPTAAHGETPNASFTCWALVSHV